MIELDRELSEETDLDRVLLSVVKHSAEAGSFLNVCGRMYLNRDHEIPHNSHVPDFDTRSEEEIRSSGGMGKLEDKESHRIDFEDAMEVADERNPADFRDGEIERIIKKSKSTIRKWAAEAEGKKFASEVAEKMQLSEGDDVINIQQRVQNAFTGHIFMRTGEKVEELLEIEEGLDANVRSRILSFIKEDSSLEDKVRYLEREVRDYFSADSGSLEQYEQKIQNLLKVFDLTRKILVELKRFDESDLNEENALENFLEGSISAENFEEKIKDHTDNRKRAKTLEGYEEEFEEIKINWTQSAKNH